MLQVRILVVDDFETWRRFVVSMLREVPRLRVICEVADGHEAAEKAEKLRPNLILLDIGLPGMNGIDAARQIRQLSPESKILFVSQESSAEVVQAALSIGAQGYVVKMDAGRELLAAIEGVARGEQFLSSSLIELQSQQSSRRSSPAKVEIADRELRDEA